MDAVGGQEENNDNGPIIMSTMNDSSELLTTDHYDDGNQEIPDNNHDIPSFIDTMATNIASAASSAAASASVARNQQSHGQANDDDGDDDDISSVTGTIMRHNHPTDEDMEDVKERYRRQLASRMYQDEAVHRQQSSFQQQHEEQPVHPPTTPPIIPNDGMSPPSPAASSSPASVNSRNQATPKHYKRQLLKQQHQQQSSYIPPTSVSPTPVPQGDTENNTSTTTTDSQAPITEEHRHESRRALESLPTAELVVEEGHEDETQDIEGGAVAPSMMSETKAQLKSLHTSVSLTDSQRSEPSSSSPPRAVAAAVVEIAIEETTRKDKQKNGSDSATRNSSKRMVYISMALVSLLLLLGVVMGTLVATGTFDSTSSSSSSEGDDSNMELASPHQDDRNSEAAIPTSPTMSPTTGPTSILEQTDPISIEWEQMGDDIISLGGGVTAQQFGKSVAMSSDGIVIAIGSPDSNFATGHVQIHEWDEQEKMWTVRGSILTGNNVGDRFGYSVSMNDDATILAVGAIGYQNNVGYVQIFQWSATNEDWIPMIVKGDNEETALQGMFVGNDNLPNSFFGRSISFNSDGTVLAIGASAFMLNVDEGSINDDGYIRVFYYDSNEQKWIQRGNEVVGGIAGERTPEQNIGTIVALSDDGTTCLTGTPTFLDTVGASIVFRYDPPTSDSNSNSDWDRTLVVRAEWGYDLSLKDYAGVTGAISRDGHYLCAGSLAGFLRIGRYVPSRGTYVMDWGDFYGIDDEGSPILSKSNNTATTVVSGESLSMAQISNNHMVVAWGVYSDDVDNDDISSTTPGRVMMYSYRAGPEETLAGTWNEIGGSSSSILYGDEVGDQFGSSTALSKDGATLVVGASQGNYVRVFRATPASTV